MKLTGGCYCKDVRYQIEAEAQAENDRPFHQAGFDVGMADGPE